MRMRDVFLSMLEDKIQQDRKNPRKTSYSITNKAIFKVMQAGKPLTIGNINDSALKIDQNYNTKRTSPHIFVTDSKSCLNGTLHKIGYRLRQNNNRVVIGRISTDEEELL